VHNDQSLPIGRIVVTCALAVIALSGCEVSRDEQRIQEWQMYGNNNSSLTDWTGADGAHSVDVGGGKVVWMFGDTYFGFINPTNPPSRAASPDPDHSTVSNTFVVQRNGTLSETVRNPFGTQRDAQGTAFNLWPRDGIVEGGKFKALAQRIDGGPGFPAGGKGPYLATFSLPNLTRESFQETQATYSTRDIGWGINMTQTPTHTYIYGSRILNGGLGPADTFVARAPAGNLLGTWLFRTASETTPWSTNEADAAPMARLLDGDVVRYASNPDKYVMVGKDGVSHVFTPKISAYISDTPHGPWQRVGSIYNVPETAADSSVISYATHFHNHDINGAGMLLSYSLCKGSGCDVGGQDASVYRPRFLRIKPSSGGGAQLEATDASTRGRRGTGAAGSDATARDAARISATPLPVRYR
jgi:hypothetical protein